MTYYQGHYIPANPKKYLGDINRIYYRSSLELRAFRIFDKNPSIVNWCSEEIIIPYLCPLDQNIHRYFVDLFVTFSNKKKYLIEIKPKRYTVKPTLTNKKSERTMLKETLLYTKNKAKWDAAEAWAKEKKINFVIWTEETLNFLENKNGK